MKITREAYETAIATAKESSVPLILTGRHGVITDVMISPPAECFDTSASMLPSMLPIGIRRYGKIITENDKDLEPGYNLVDKDGRWVFVNEDGDELAVDIVEDIASEVKDRGIFEVR